MATQKTSSRFETKSAAASGAGVNDIRSAFLRYFEKNGHTIVPSSSLVPRNDPTLMFANSGMVQFKNVFVGAENRDYARATTAQKCVRAGGKHNDLDNVGYTARHHTFFEMLGNFSFGDYFKERAIELAWILVTKEYGLDPKRLMVTVYSEDDQAHGLWKKIAGLPDSKIVRIPTSDNFWRMGDTGPCGPCSEIFYDHDPDGKKGIRGGPPGSPDADGDRFIEIWNLVFMQYEERGGGRVDLPKPSIDTGMGLERIAAVMQGVHDNYEIDLFGNLIQDIRTKVRAAGGQTLDRPDGSAVDTAAAAMGRSHKAAERVIADHLRASSFLIADGVLPSNEGRGYVLRRIMRRAMRFAYQLGCKEPLMHALVPSLIREMGAAYPELVRAQALVAETLKLEETRFRQTVGNGIKLLEQNSQSLTSGQSLSGDVAFKLYDTYGFPLDLTQDFLKPRGIAVDTKAFDSAMATQKAEARKAWKGSGDAATDAIWFELKEQQGATEFLGYDTETAEAEIRAILKDGKFAEQLQAGEDAQIIVNQTPFYGESGGQSGDQGIIRAGKTGEFQVLSTQKKLGDIWVHSGHMTAGTLRTGDAVVLEVDHARRSATRANHSATHLLHEALRQVLGEHVAQKGSLVDATRLRFDFSQPKPISAAQLSAVEDLANAIVLQNAPVDTRLMAVDDAVKTGAMALFGEKYGDEVRVVSMGANQSGKKVGKSYSVELCGGTHVQRTGDIGIVRIISEGATSAGVRRIEALTADAARRHLAEQDARVRAAAGLLKIAPADLVERISTIAEERRKLERQVNDLKRQLAMSATSGAGDSAVPGGGEIATYGQVKLLARKIDGVALKDLRGLVDDGKKQIGSGIVAIVGVSEDGKAAVAVGVTPDLTAAWNAIDLVRLGAEALGGKGGGGRPDMAQAGGPDGEKATMALAAIREHVQARASG